MFMCIYIYIYIYIYSVYGYIYIYIYIHGLKKFFGIKKTKYHASKLDLNI